MESAGIVLAMTSTGVTWPSLVRLKRKGATSRPIPLYVSYAHSRDAPDRTPFPAPSWHTMSRTLFVFENPEADVGY